MQEPVEGARSPAERGVAWLWVAPWSAAVVGLYLTAAGRPTAADAAAWAIVARVVPVVLAFHFAMRMLATATLVRRVRVGPWGVEMEPEPALFPRVFRLIVSLAVISGTLLLTAAALGVAVLARDADAARHGYILAEAGVLLLVMEALRVGCLVVVRDPRRIPL